MLSYERKWRFKKPLDDYFSADAIPEAGASLGNIFTYGEVGGMVRFGHNIGADYGPSRYQAEPFGYRLVRFRSNCRALWVGISFAGLQGRAVGHNIFLDGNSWRSSPNVDKKLLVGDMLGGRIAHLVGPRADGFYVCAAFCRSLTGRPIRTSLAVLG